MKKYNILFITSAQRIAGAERVLMSIFKNLNSDKFSLIVLMPGGGTLLDELKKSRVKVIQLSLIKKLNLFKMTFRLKKLKLYNPFTIILNTLWVGFYFILSVIILPLVMRRLKVDILHIHSDDIAARSLIAAALVKIPAVLHSHSILEPHPDNWLLRRSLDMPSRTVCVSNAVRRLLLPWVNQIDKIKTIYLGIDSDDFNDNFDPDKVAGLKKSLNLNNFVIGMLGRLDPAKGHETFLRAASKVVKTMDNVSFLVVGSWALDFEKPRVQYLKEYSDKLGLGKKVVFTGFQSDVKTYYHSMDIITLPSLNEPFALVPLEAMACRKPVIATDSGGTSELIQDGVSGILFAPNDSDALAQAIIRLLNDSKLGKKFSLQGLKNIELYFNSSRYIKDLEKVYEESITQTR